MTVADYFAGLKSQVANHPHVSTFWFQEDVRTRIIGGIKAQLLFRNGVALNFREFVFIESNHVTKLSYSYNCRKHKLIFRYDNAPHHPKLAGAPHHKHVGNGRVIPSKEPTLQQILLEISLEIK